MFPHFYKEFVIIHRYSMDCMASILWLVIYIFFNNDKILIQIFCLFIYIAVRSGDYYMFDDFDDDDDMMDLIPDFDAEFDADDQRRQPRHSRTRRMTVSEVSNYIISI